MRRQIQLVVALVAATAVPATAAAKLDKEAERWLKEVHLLILPDEERIYRDLKDPADRKEFERIFWARRDPDLATPGNEFHASVVRALAKADAVFSTSRGKGSESGCGQLLALLGDPREVEGREIKAKFDSVEAMRAGARRAETWTYRSRPGEAVQFTGGELRVALDEDCRFAEGGRVLEDLRRVAAAKVVQPRLTYDVKPDGHLTRLEERADPGIGSRAILQSPRTDFPLALEPKMLLRTGSGEGYAAGLIRADLSGLRETGGVPPAMMAATVVAQAVDAAGQAGPAFERAVNGPVAADGVFVASYGVTLKPGRYTLRVALVSGEKSSVSSTPVEVPDYDAPGLKLGSLLVYPDTTEPAAVDAKGPDAAFAIGPLRLHPRLGNAFSPADSLQAVCVLYGGQADPATGKPSLRARFRFLKDGRPVASGQEETFDTVMAVASVGPVPLATFAPGHYIARLEARDAVSGKSETQETPFEIRP